MRAISHWHRRCDDGDMNTMRWLCLSFLVSSALAPASADAQSSEWRLDVAVPRFGGGVVVRESGRHDGFAEGQLELRLLHRSGHGLSLRGGIALGATDMYPMIDADYVLRSQLLGTSRLGLTLDWMAGLSGGRAEDCVGVFGCTDRPAVDGGRIGPNAGASLTFEAYGFFLDLDARYRLVVPTDRAMNGEVWEPEHVFTVSAGIGFHFD